MATTMQTYDMRPIIGALKSWKGFKSFEDPGDEYVDVERTYKLVASERMRALFAEAELRAMIAANDMEGLFARYRSFVAENGFANLIDWRDKGVLLDDLLRSSDPSERLKLLFGAVVDLYAPGADIADVADRIAFALRGEDAAELKGHTWSCVSYIAMTIAPERFVYVKPDRSNRFFRRLGGTYRRPTPFSGRAYADYMARCREVIDAMTQVGLRPLDMIDLQSTMWIVGDYTLELPGTEPMDVDAGEADEDEPRDLDHERDVEAYIRHKGFAFPSEVIANYTLALMTKPFVILSGISGTGKTKIAQCFAECMTAGERVLMARHDGDTNSVFFVPASPTFLVDGYIDLDDRLKSFFEGLPAPVGKMPVDAYLDGEREAMVEVVVAQDGHTTLHADDTVRAWLKANVGPQDWVRFEIDDDGDLVLSTWEAWRDREGDERRVFIAVRPDWTDNRGLLGYYNPLTERYVPTEFLKLMLRAAEDPRRPYFAILDEMNLARVEHYFSDFLSCLESRMAGSTGECITLHHQPEALEFEDEDGRAYAIPPKLAIPWNLYFTGTVNVDESTYMFSPKVLDRANTIEFNAVDLDHYGGDGAVEDAGEFRLRRPPMLGAAGVAVKADYEELHPAIRSQFAQLNRLLATSNLHFGYRVANEMARYIRLADVEVGPQGRETAVDLQLLQKVLPKFHGSRAKLERPLAAVLRFCLDGEAVPADQALGWYQQRAPYLAVDGAQHLIDEGQSFRYPRTAAKVFRMIEALRDQGYASFIV